MGLKLQLLGVNYAITEKIIIRQIVRQDIPVNK